MVVCGGLVVVPVPWCSPRGMVVVIVGCMVVVATGVVDGVEPVWTLTHDVLYRPGVGLGSRGPAG